MSIQSFHANDLYQDVSIAETVSPCHLLDCEDDDESLFVGNIPLELSKDEVLKLLSSLGAISVSPLMLQRNAPGSFFAFAFFGSKELAAKAFHKCKRQPICWQGATLRLGRALSNRRLYIGSVPKEINEADLRNLFERFGSLAEDGVLIFRKQESPGQPRFAVIAFNSRTSAQEARRNLNHTVLKDCTLRVDWYHAPKMTSGHQSMSSISMQTSIASNVEPAASVPRLPHDSSLSPPVSLYVQFETMKEGVNVNAELIALVFEEFGYVDSVHLKSHFISLDDRKQFGYGFVHFDSGDEGVQSAYNAFLAVGNGKRGHTAQPFTRESVLFRCELSRNYHLAFGMTSRSTGNESVPSSQSSTVDDNGSTHSDHDSWGNSPPCFQQNFPCFYIPPSYSLPPMQMQWQLPPTHPMVGPISNVGPWYEPPYFPYPFYYGTGPIPLSQIQSQQARLLPMNTIHYDVPAPAMIHSMHPRPFVIFPPSILPGRYRKDCPGL